MGERNPTSNTTDGALLSIVQVPSDLQQSELAAALIEYAGLDEYAGRQGAKQVFLSGAPQIVALIPGDRREAVTDGLSSLGILAFAPTRDELAAFHEPLLVKRMITDSRGGGPDRGFRLQMWRNQSDQRFALKDVSVLVRGVLTSRRVRTQRTREHTMGASALASGVSSGGSRRSASSRLTHMLDIYLRDGTRHRLNADKLSFDMLGKSKSYADSRNMDLLVRALRRLMPRAIVDERFGRFRLPPPLRDERISMAGNSTVRTSSEAGAFDIYSPWIFLLYSYLPPA